MRSLVKTLTLAALSLWMAAASQPALASGSVPKRSEIPEPLRWKLEDIYPTDEAWEADYAAAKEALPRMGAFRGTLGRSPRDLLACLAARDDLGIRVGKLVVYATMRSHEDTANPVYQALADRASTLSVQVSEAGSFVVPEILSVPEKTLQDFQAREPGLAPYRFTLSELLRQKAHVLSQPEEALLAGMGEVLQAPEGAFSMLTNADLKFPQITDEKGKAVELSEERYAKFLRSPDRKVREAAFRGLFETYGKFRNTLGATFSGAVKGSAFVARARKYPSSLAAALDGDAIPESVYHNVVDTIEKNLAPLHRYMALRRRVLGLAKLAPWDLYVPLVADPDREIPWERAVEQVTAGLTLLGPDYLGDLKAGLSSRWVDVLENQGKRSGAYSWGSYGTHPYILMNYNGTLHDVFTLAHELGHSLHSFYSNRSQPYADAGYTTFVAEVASTTNEALLLDHLLREARDQNTKLFLLNQRLEQIRTTVYRQALFASFERTVHRRVEAGEALTPEDLGKLWHQLNERYYGPDLEVDPLLDGEWSRIPHFYSPFYVFQYATGYAAATSLSRQIQKEGEPARKRYLHMLTRGGSAHPIDLLRDAGVDMATPQPLLDTLRVFEETLDAFEELANRK